MPRSFSLFPIAAAKMAACQSLTCRPKKNPPHQPKPARGPNSQGGRRNPASNPCGSPRRRTRTSARTWGTRCVLCLLKGRGGESCCCFTVADVLPINVIAQHDARQQWQPRAAMNIACTTYRNYSHRLLIVAVVIYGSRIATIRTLIRLWRKQRPASDRPLYGGMRTPTQFLRSADATVAACSVPRGSNGQTLSTLPTGIGCLRFFICARPAQITHTPMLPLNRSSALYAQSFGCVFHAALRASATTSSARTLPPVFDSMNSDFPKGTPRIVHKRHVSGFMPSPAIAISLPPKCLINLSVVFIPPCCQIIFGMSNNILKFASQRNFGYLCS